MAFSVHQDYGSKDASKLLCVTDISIQQCGSWLALTSSLLSCPRVRCIYYEVRVRLQGVRIDYALCTPGLLPKVVSCELDNLPPKWSDHAALMLGERALALRTFSCSHLPCLMGFEVQAASACCKAMAESAALMQEVSFQCDRVASNACRLLQQALTGQVGEAAAACLSCVRTAFSQQPRGPAHTPPASAGFSHAGCILIHDLCGDPHFSAFRAERCQATTSPQTMLAIL